MNGFFFALLQTVGPALLAGAEATVPATLGVLRPPGVTAMELDLREERGEQTVREQTGEITRTLAAHAANGG